MSTCSLPIATQARLTFVPSPLGPCEQPCAAPASVVCFRSPTRKPRVCAPVRRCHPDFRILRSCRGNYATNADVERWSCHILKVSPDRDITHAGGVRRVGDASSSCAAGPAHAPFRGLLARRSPSALLLAICLDCPLPPILRLTSHLSTLSLLPRVFLPSRVPSGRSSSTFVALTTSRKQRPFPTSNFAHVSPQKPERVIADGLWTITSRIMENEMFPALHAQFVSPPHLPCISPLPRRVTRLPILAHRLFRRALAALVGVDYGAGAQANGAAAGQRRGWPVSSVRVSAESSTCSGNPGFQVSRASKRRWTLRQLGIWFNHDLRVTTCNRIQSADRIAFTHFWPAMDEFSDRRWSFRTLVPGSTRAFDSSFIWLRPAQLFQI
eukprot:2965960-Pleurochrysis_carterae.AAC.3